jgi:hypothetical protein
MSNQGQSIRYDYAGSFHTWEGANNSLENMWAFGEVGPLEEPKIEARSRRIHGKQSTVYYITLLG